MGKIIPVVAIVVLLIGGGVWYLSRPNDGDVQLQAAAAAQTEAMLGGAAASPSPAPSADSSVQEAHATSTGVAPAQSVAASVQAPASPAPAQVDLSKITRATLHTNQGDITVSFDSKDAPVAVTSFLKLAANGFYDGTKFHRVIKGFMIQGGDPLTKDDSQQARWGTGGPGYTFDDEIYQGNSNVEGAVAMANSGPNTNGSQFFINTVANPSLNTNYTVFGHVVSGMDVVHKIEVTPTGANDRPLSPMIVTSVTLK